MSSSDKLMNAANWTVTHADISELLGRMKGFRRQDCKHDHRTVRRHLRAMSRDRNWRESVLGDLIELGGTCDCEVVLNVMPLWQEED